MPLQNLGNAHLSNAQVTALDAALTALEAALAPINPALTAAERQQYGAINEQNKLLVNKVYDYNRSQNTLSSPDVDWAEFDKDYQSRTVIEGAINRLRALLTRLENAKVLHDYDNYHAALEDYAHTSYKAGRGANGFEAKYNELKQFFPRTRRATVPDAATGGSNPAPENE